LLRSWLAFCFVLLLLLLVLLTPGLLTKWQTIIIENINNFCLYANIILFQGCVVDGQTFARDRQRQSAARNSTRNLEEITKQHYGGREFHSTTMIPQDPALSILFPPLSIFINLQLSTSLSTLYSFKPLAIRTAEGMLLLLFPIRSVSTK
jgi:hypothetical protein